MQTYPDIFRSLRKARGLRQHEVAARLNAMGIETTPAQVSRWEKGRNNPNLQQFIALTHIYSIKDVFTVFETKNRENIYSDINAAGLKKLDEYRELLVSSGLYSPSGTLGNITYMEPRYLPVYDIAASAGTGQFLDSDHYEMTEVPEDVPESASFGLHVAGDSMEPTLHSGDVIWVRMQSSLENGDLGVFFLDGCAYVKEYHEDKGGISLISHNRSYAPIRVDREESRIYGRVVYPKK